MVVNGYLIVRADGSTRTVTKTPRLAMDEFAFRLRITLPESWGHVLGSIDVEVPDTVVPSIQIDIAELEPATCVSEENT